jgi:hypothetical protein
MSMKWRRNGPAEADLYTTIVHDLGLIPDGFWLILLAGGGGGIGQGDGPSIGCESGLVEVAMDSREPRRGKGVAREACVPVSRMALISRAVTLCHS